MVGGLGGAGAAGGLEWERGGITGKKGGGGAGEEGARNERKGGKWEFKEGGNNFYRSKTDESGSGEIKERKGEVLTLLSPSLPRVKHSSFQPVRSLKAHFPHLESRATKAVVTRQIKHTRNHCHGF